MEEVLMKKIKCIIVWLLFFQLVCFTSIKANASIVKFSSNGSTPTEKALVYLNKQQETSGTWGDHEKIHTADILNILENFKVFSDLDEYTISNKMIKKRLESCLSTIRR